MGGEEGPAFQWDYCLFKDTLPAGDSDLVGEPGCKSGMGRMQKRVGTSERMGEDHEVRAPLCRGCEGGIILWFPGWDTWFRLRGPRKWSGRLYSCH